MPDYFEVRARADYRRLSRRQHQRIADRFNAQCGIGTRVRVWLGRRGCEPTKVIRVISAACVGQADRAVVKTPDGYIELTHIEVVEPRAPAQQTIDAPREPRGTDDDIA